jgi:hypothetical protein
MTFLLELLGLVETAIFGDRILLVRVSDRIGMIGRSPWLAVVRVGDHICYDSACDQLILSGYMPESEI